jgi:hypothetical protein
MIQRPLGGCSGNLLLMTFLGFEGMWRRRYQLKPRCYIVSSRFVL